MKRWIVVTISEGDYIPCRTLDIILFRCLWLWVSLGANVAVKQVRILPNTDIQLRSEPLPPPEHWSMQPRRPDGTPW